MKLWSFSSGLTGTCALFSLPTHLLKLCRSLWRRICAGHLNCWFLPWWTPGRGHWVWVNTEHRSRAANLRSGSWIGNSWAQALPYLVVPPPSLLLVSRQEERLLLPFRQTTEVAKSGNQSLSTAQKKQRANPSCAPDCHSWSVMLGLRKCKYVFPCRRENYRQTQLLKYFWRQGLGSWLLSASRRNRRVIKNSSPCALEASKGGEECRAARTWSNLKHTPALLGQTQTPEGTTCCHQVLFWSGDASLVR